MHFRKNQTVSFKQAPGVYYIQGWEDGIEVTTKIKNRGSSMRKERVYFIKDVMERKDVVYQAFGTELAPLDHSRTRSGYVPLPSKKHVKTIKPRVSAPEPIPVPPAPCRVPDTDLGIFMNFLSSLH